MAYRLKDRNKQIPNGYKFVQPETGWQAQRFASFYSIARDLKNHRLGRPDLVTKHGWRTDAEGVEFDVEQFNVRLCLQHGWGEYLDGLEVGGGLPPKSKTPSQQEVEQVGAAAGRAEKIWSGVKILNDWIDSGEPPVSAELSNSRASICASCSKNTTGDFTAWFTKPAAGAIQKQVEKLADRKLSTLVDDKINVCDVCLCPLKLKVHTPLTFIKVHMKESVYVDLQKVTPKCWICSELEANK